MEQRISMLPHKPPAIAVLTHAQTRHTTSIATNSAPYTRLIMTSALAQQRFGLIVSVSCLLCSSALPGVWSFLRVTHSVMHCPVQHMEFLCVHADSILHSMSSPFHSFVSAQCTKMRVTW